MKSSWTEAALGEVATITMGQAPPGSAVAEWEGQHPGEAQGLPFIQGNAEFGGTFPSPTKWCSVPAKTANEGDVLISVRAPVGALNWADRRLAIGRGLAAIRFTEVDPRFGWHALHTVSAQLARVAQGSTFDAINSRDLRNLSISFPLPEAQAHIADTLDALDEAVNKSEAAIEATERLRKALAQELLTRGMPGWHSEWKRTPGIGTVPACWEVLPLGTVSAFQGGLAKNGKAALLDPVELPYLRVANVQDGYLDLTELKTIGVERAGWQRFALRRGDVLFTEGGDFDKLGRGTVWPGRDGPCLHQNHVFVVRPRSDRLFSEYLAIYAASVSARRYFLTASKQTTNLASINATQLRSLPVPVPPLEEQHSMIEHLEAIDRARDVEQRCAAVLSSLKAMLASALIQGSLRLAAGAAARGHSEGS